MQITRERLYFTALLAVSLHLVLLLGFNIAVLEPTPTQTPLAIALQSGGDPRTQDGTTAQKNSVATSPTSEPQPERMATDTHNDLSRTDTFLANSSRAAPPPNNDIGETSPQKTRVLDPRNLAQQIVLLDLQTQQKMGDSRIRNLDNVGKPTSVESAYLAMWRRKCERLGGNNYPAGNLQGELTMRVVIHHSGTLSEVSLLRSSGHPVLDQAALNTVRQAAPYQPFNVDMRKRYDELSFTRTWQFSRRGPLIN